MIKSLKISNYTLLKNACVNFNDGFTVISGETGAGKSVMLDALSLLLGKRVERFSLNDISTKAIIEGVFYIKKSKYTFFEDNNLDFQELTIIRRELYPDGRSRAFINDSPVLLNILSDFRNQIIEIHSQNQSNIFKDEFAQFSLIDKLAKSDKELNIYQNELIKYKQLNIDLETIKKSGSLSASELDFLQYQLEELESYNFKIDEKDDLEKKISLLENLEGIKNIISDCDHILNNELGIISQLSSLKRKLSEYDNFSKFYKRIDSVLIELDDISSNFNSLEHEILLDPSELVNYNTRLDNINRTLIKHRKENIEDLLAYKKEIQSKIQLSVSFDVEFKKKQQQLNSQFFILQAKASELNNKRLKVLPALKLEIEKSLKALGMPYAQFNIEINLSDNFNQFGNADLSFLFSANKGFPLLEISKVASGGELSRLMLAIKYISAKSSEVSTLIFDEIDIGVSGEIASLMGKMMQDISKTTQLIVISHLPQIASKAKEHFKVVKSVIDGETISDVVLLSQEQRVEEIAKLLSGKEVTSVAFKNAQVLLRQ